MKKINLLVFRSFIGPFIMTFVVVVFIHVMQFFFVYIDDFIGKGLEWYIVAELVFYLTANTVPVALPLAVLLSSIMCYGNLGEKYELTALKSSGISLLKFLTPAVFVVGVIAIASLAFSNWVMPKANLKFYTTLLDITQQKPALNIKEDVYYRDIQNYVIKVDEKSPDNRGINNVYILNLESHLANDDITLAERGEMFTTEDNRYLVLNLYNGSRYEVLPPDKEKPGTKLHVRTYFDKMEKVFDLSDFEMTRSSEDMFKDHYIMMSISQLNYYIDSMHRQNAKVKQDIRELLKPHIYFLRDSSETLPAPESTGLTTYKPPVAKEQQQKVFTRASAFVKNIQNNIDLPLLVQYNNTHMFLIRADIELQRKFMLSVACMILLFIGAPFGAIVRKGGFGYPVLFALLFYIFYFILFQVGEELAKKEILATFAGIWLPTIIMLPIGIFFTYKAMNDSPLFNIESYISTFKKLKFWGKG